MPTSFSLRAAARASRFTLGLFVLIAAAEQRDVAAQQPNVVSGTVRTTDGRPLAGATIRVSGATGAARGTTVRTQSDRDGHYRVDVRPGHYDVDAFYDLAFDGQTYRELWLDRTNEGCGRQLSEPGIVRHFVLRLAGPLRCSATFDANEPASYAGGMVQVIPGRVPASATVRFTLTPIGGLADGTRGRALTFERTGAMLGRTGGPLGQTAWLHDIPLGRYRVSADAILPGGQRRPLVLRDSTGGAAATAIEIGFAANRMFPYGMQAATIAIADGPEEPAPAPRTGDDVSRPAETGRVSNGSLPAGRYDCSYRSEYAGEIPTDRTIVILDGGRYQAWGGSGSYTGGAGAIRWTSGPLAQRNVSVTFAEQGGRAVLLVKGGPAASDPGGTNRCVRYGG